MIDFIATARKISTAQALRWFLDLAGAPTAPEHEPDTAGPYPPAPTRRRNDNDDDGAPDDESDSLF